MSPALLLAAACLFPPVDGPIADPFAPLPPYGGHWGIDLEVPWGTPVRSALDGRVSFAGRVAGNRTVTVASGDLRLSYSYLAGIRTVPGRFVRAGEVLGHSGLAHGHPGVHFSVRRHGRYVDPAPLLRCEGQGGLRLLPRW